MPPAPPLIRYFGDYALMGEIAAGGMGVVYCAKQLTLNRRVALKMIRAGQFATAEEVQRFRREAEAAARLQHPHIVAIHEVGEFEGQQFYSMEYVAGDDLARRVQAGLPTSEQAARWTQRIAEALHHAHQRGILHRDLKPANVLLDEHDEPRVTDFGLAKFLQERKGWTVTALAGTPEFMSPEQADPGRGEITTASDVYALGALLYFLLTGEPPFRKDSLQQTLLAVLNELPVPPRTKKPTVPRDLETICLKCLNKEPGRRYKTALEVAEDLGRFLNREPIEARAVGTAERLWFWCRRKPALASLTGALVLVGFVAFGIVLWQRNEYKTEAANRARVVQILEDMFRGVGPRRARGLDTALLKELVTDKVQQLSRDAKLTPDIKAQLLNTLGIVYLELADYSRAEELFAESLALRKSHYGSEHPAVAASASNLGEALRHQGKLAEAEDQHRTALAILRREHGEEHHTVAQSLGLLGLVLKDRGQLAEAELRMREALAIFQKLPAADQRDTPATRHGLAEVLRRQNKLADAEIVQREALAALRAWPGHSALDVAAVLNNLAGFVRDQGPGRLAEAEQLQREALTLVRENYGPDHPSIPGQLNNLAELLKREGRLAEAENQSREALVLVRRRYSPAHPRVIVALNNLAQFLQDQGEPAKLAEAEALRREALAIERQAAGAATNNSAQVLAPNSQGPATETSLRAALAGAERQSGPEERPAAMVRDALARNLLRQRKFSEAEVLARTNLVIFGKFHTNYWRTHDARSLVGACLLGQTNFADAEPLLLASYAGLKQPGQRISAGNEGCVREALERLVQLYEATARPAEAAAWKQKLAEYDAAAMKSQPAAKPDGTPSAVPPPNQK